MISVREVIHEYIIRKGNVDKYGLECVNAFNKYFSHYHVQLENCSLFESVEKENALSIRYIDHKYRIYQTDNNAKCISNVQSFNNEREAYRAFMKLYNLQNKPYNMDTMEISVEEIIGIFIQYKGNRQGLWTDYGTLFQTYLNRFSMDLKKCSLFDLEEKSNSLSIRYKKETNLYYIYQTDENGNKCSNVFTYVDYFDATKKYIELYHEIKLNI